MKQSYSYRYRVVWHESGCVVFRNDGARVPIIGKRLSTDEVNQMSSAEIAAMSPWKRFRKD
jgi:hypothetical protein